MTELEEKKIVAEWMGNDYWKDEPENEDYELKMNNRFTSLGNWSPQSDDLATFKEWAEIYENITSKEWSLYMKVYEDIPQKPIGQYWRIHTAKPSVRWKALLIMIQSGK